ncbi:hypothetical protein RHMOL_Rhmol02G0109500 [Rhododendron molle]|uniref:Uncharacterized protein n=1 Tax=Rhododendron molle TaxID=49168 RepID=A0ACC0PNJ2_RHOML|nr:hypothetical protein RHMOL_Rhmol02G0109500 [Rhododendron molle]
MDTIIFLLNFCSLSPFSTFPNLMRERVTDRQNRRRRRRRKAAASGHRSSLSPIISLPLSDSLSP